jgi:hypothetical protein
VYDKTYEQLTSKLRQLGLLEIPAAYEYRWSPEADQTFGPFTREELAAWKAQGFFDQASVFIRKVQSGGPFVELGASGLFAP